MTQDEVKTIMHERICALLEECKRDCGKSYRKIEKDMGLSQGRLKDIKNNKRMLKTETVVRLANYSGIRMDWILGRCDDSGKYAKPGRKTEPGHERLDAPERLGMLLERRRMTPWDLAKALGISYFAAYSAWEGDALSQPWIQIAYADYFGVTVDWLLGMEE